MRRSPAAALAALRSRLGGAAGEGRSGATQLAEAMVSSTTEGQAVCSSSSSSGPLLFPHHRSLTTSAPALAAIPAAPSSKRARVLHRAPASARHRERMPVDPYTRPPVTYVQLLQHIRGARDVEALEQLVDAHAARFDAVHAAAALSVLPKLTSASALEQPTPEGSRRPARLMARLQALAVQQRERMHARQIANAVWSAGRCRQLVSAAARDERRRAVGAQRLPTSALLQAAQLQEEEEGEEGQRPQQQGDDNKQAVASTLATAQLLALEREQGRARLRQQRSEAAKPRWRGDAVGAALEQLPTSHDLDAGPTAASRAAVRELLRELGRGGFRKLYQGGTPADAAQLLHGLARLRLPPPPSLLRHLRSFVAKRCAEFDARHLAVSTWALSRLAGLEREAQQQQQAKRRRAQGGGLAAPPPVFRRRAEGLAAPLPGDLAEVIVARALQQADFFRPWSMCAVLYAFARPAPPAKQQQQQQQQQQGRGEEGEGEGAEAAAMTADYRALGRALAEGFAPVVVAEADARAPNPQQTATLAWAYGRLRVWGSSSSEGGDATTTSVAAALSRCALDSLESFGPTDLSMLVSGLAESAAAGVREYEGAGASSSSSSSFTLPADVSRLLGAVARGIADERAVRLSSAEDAARLLRGYASVIGKGLYLAEGDDDDAAAAAAVEGMALRLAGGAAAHARAAPATTARELATLLPRLLLLRRRGSSKNAGLNADGSDAEDEEGEAIAVATADLARAAAEAGLSSDGGRRGEADEDAAAWDSPRCFEGTEAAELLDALSDAAADRASSASDARLLAALLHARGALGLQPHDALCRAAAARLGALAAQVQELGAAASSAATATPTSPLLRPLEQLTDLAVGLADARRLGAEGGAAAARAALAASAAAAEPKPKLRTLARLCRALSSDVAVMQQAPVRSLFEACAGPMGGGGGGGGGGDDGVASLPAGAAAAAAVALARAIRHGHAQGAAASRDLVLRLADAAEAAAGGPSSSVASIARDVDEARACVAVADAMAEATARR